MITSKDVDVVWVSYFQGKEKTDGFDTLSASVNIVSQEKIARR